MHLTLDGREVLMGVSSGQDGVDAWHPPQNAMGRIGLGSFKGSRKIVSGMICNVAPAP